MLYRFFFLLFANRRLFFNSLLQRFCKILVIQIKYTYFTISILYVKLKFILYEIYFAVNVAVDTYGDLRMAAHTGVSQVTYPSNLYSSPQASSRIVPYQPVYYDLITSQQQSHQLLETHSPKIECPSPPCTTRSPGIVSANQSPDHHQLTSPHIVTLSSPSTSPAGSKIMLDNGHLERSTVVSISS